MSIKLGALSAREKQVVQLVVQGKSNKEISDALNIAESTVEKHLCKIYRKLGVFNRTGAALAVTASTAHGGNPP